GGLPVGRAGRATATGASATRTAASTTGTAAGATGATTACGLGRLLRPGRGLAQRRRDVALAGALLGQVDLRATGAGLGLAGGRPGGRTGRAAGAHRPQRHLAADQAWRGRAGHATRTAG